MRYEQRKPDFRITICRPDYTSPAYSEKVVTEFSPKADVPALLSYSFRNDLSAFDAPFSLVLTPILVNDKGGSLIDAIHQLDVVKIEEFGILKYVGVVDSVRYAARMSGGVPDRTITVQGFGVGGILNRFSMLLDQVILSDAQTAVAALETKFRGLMGDLSAKYGENTSMTLILDNIKKAFMETMALVGGYTPGGGMSALVDEYLKVRELANSDAATKYPIALSLFSYGAITLGEAFRQVVAAPFYEMFTRWDATAGRWALVVRPTPYSPAAWRNLRITEIDPLIVDTFDAGFSSADVKTFFFAYLSGGALTYEKVRSMYQNTAIKKDSAKWAVYGYRPLEAQFKFVDQIKLAANQRISLTKAADGDPNEKPEVISDEKLMEECATKLQRWFGRADEMLSGSLSMMTMKDGPAIGERISFDSVEFYVESLASSWQYGGSMTTSLALTRGGTYNPNFAFGTGPNGDDVETKENWWFKRSEGIAARLELVAGGD